LEPLLKSPASWAISVTARISVFFRIRGGPGGIDDLACFREGRAVDGQRPDRTDTGIEGKIVEIEFDAVAGEFCQQLPGDRILNRSAVDGRRR